MSNIIKNIKETPKLWNDTQVVLLKKWGEQSASYRVLHNKSYRKYKWLTGMFTIPVIIISTLTGTANFSQGTIIQIYPNFRLYLPLVIGALNLISGIITTIGQYLRVSELNESNRNASIAYGKFARNISTELSLPPNERTYCGLDFIQICRNEMDRLIEQSPEVSMKIIREFEKNKKFKNIIKPDLINISPINIWEPSKDDKTKEIVAGAANQFRRGFLNRDLKEAKEIKSFDLKDSNKRNVELELLELRDNKAANNSITKKKVSSILEKNTENNNGDTLNMNYSKNKIQNLNPPKISISDLITSENIKKLKEEKNIEIQNKHKKLNDSVIINVDLLKSNLKKNIDKEKNRKNKNIIVNKENVKKTNTSDENVVVKKTNTSDENVVVKKTNTDDENVVVKKTNTSDDEKVVVKKTNTSDDEKVVVKKTNTDDDNTDDENTDDENVVVKKTNTDDENTDDENTDDENTSDDENTDDENTDDEKTSDEKTSDEKKDKKINKIKK